MTAAVGLLLAALAPMTPASGFGSSTPPAAPPAVNAGGYMTCGIRADSLAACWGENGGTGNEGPGQSTPPAGVTFKEVNAGYSHACGVKTDDTVACWGTNNHGQSNAPAGTFKHVAAGFVFSCGLRTDGTAACWGRDEAKQVTNTPVTETFTQLTVGVRHACGLRADGSVVCWGGDAFGQVSKLPAAERFSQINSGNFDTCGLRSADGTAVCWGRNVFNQASAPEGAFTQIATGFAHVCGLREDKTITCWGDDAQSQGSPPAGTYRDVSAGTFHSCGMTTDNKAICWGLNRPAGRVAPMMLSDEPQPVAVVGQPYSHQFRSTYFSPNSGWSLAAGTLPPGLTLTSDGLLSGTPTKPGNWTGIKVSAGNGLSVPATEDFGIAVAGQDDGIDNCALQSNCVVGRATKAAGVASGYLMGTVADVYYRNLDSPCRLLLPAFDQDASNCELFE